MTTHDTILGLVKGGHMAQLTGNPLSVLMVYVAHAGADGTAWPSLDTICTLTGISAQNNVCTARKVLIDLGLLELVRRTRTSTIYRVKIEATGKARPATAAGRDSLKIRQSGNETVHNSDSPISRLETVHFSDSDQSENQTQKQTKNQDTKQAISSARAADAAGRTGGEARRERIVEPKPAHAPQPRKPADRKLSDEHNAAREAFIAWWCDVAYPQAFAGVAYEFGVEGSRNGQAVKKLLGFTRYDLEQAKRIALFYLRSDPIFGAPNLRPLFGITAKFQFWVQSERGARSMPYANHGARYGPRHQHRVASGARITECDEPDDVLGAYEQRGGPAGAGAAQRPGGGGAAPEGAEAGRAEQRRAAV